MSRIIRSIMIPLVVIFVFSGAVEPKRPTITALSKIDTVTVYPNQSLVTRVAQIKLAPGDVCVLFQNLPELLLEDSVRVSGRGSAAASVTDIRIGRGSAADEATSRLTALKKSVEDLNGQIQSLDDRLEILGKKSDFLNMAMNTQNLSKESGDAIQKKGVMEWPRMLAYFDEQLTKNTSEKRRIENDKKEILEKKQAGEYELNQFASLQKKERRTVQVDLQVERAGEEELILTYLVPGPSWNPAYELCLYSDKKEARLTCQAMVRQQTGEDWENAHLTLSTSRPSESKKVPELKPWRIGLVDSTWGMISGTVQLEDGSPLPGVMLKLSQNGTGIVQSLTSENGRFFLDKLNPGTYELEASLQGFQTKIISSIVVRSGQTARFDFELKLGNIEEAISIEPKPKYKWIDDERTAAAAEAPQEELQEKSANYTESDTATTFSVESDQTVLSGDAPQKMTVAIVPVVVEKEYVCIPKLDQTAYMRARFIYNGSFTLAAGRCSLLLDNSYMASMMLPSISAGEEMIVNVGAVTGIRVKHERLEIKKSESGLLSNTVQLVREFQITLESFLKQPVSVTVLDHLPVTESKEVEIDLLQVSPETEKAAIEKEKKLEGELRWQVKLDPREKKVIRFKFRISHPKKKPLVGMD